LIDTDHAVIVDVEATPARLAQEIIATKAMLERVEQTHHLRPEKLAADKAYGTGPISGLALETQDHPAYSGAGSTAPDRRLASARGLHL